MEANPIESLLRSLCKSLLLRCLFVAAAMAPGVSQCAEKETAETFAQKFEDATEEQLSDSALDKDAARFDSWEPLLEEQGLEQDNTVPWNDPSVKPIDWARHFGFRHSSSDGRYSGKGLPMEGTSWLNRPLHADWFMGSLLGSELVDGRVDQGNDVIAGVRIGYDFDYYWGLDWRFGWSKPNAELANPDPAPRNANYFISDVDLKYYPWGDSQVRPFGLLGMGLVRIDFIDDTGRNFDTTLATLPFGAGVEFHQWPWLVWRLEILDNLAFGASGVETLNNFSFVAGMEFRFGSRPQSYWPWRSSRKIW